MSAPPPPPPPPHGEVPKSSGLPPGKYDIFVIPEHSSGSGFLYLPSLQPNINSFAAGFASALILVAVFQSMAPAFRAWWESFQGLGNMGITLLIVGVGFGAWALGRTQNDAPGGPGTSGHGGHGFEGSTPGTGANTSAPPPPPHGTPPPGGPPPAGPPPSGPPPSQDKPKPSWQRPPQPGTARAETPKGSWEKAREEMKKKEEERKAKEAEQKRREDTARRLAELRAKEARERQEREKERERREKETKADKDRLDAEKRAKDLEAKLQQEKTQREKLEKEAKERDNKRNEEAGAARKGSSYAYSGVGEKTTMWPNGRPPVPSHTTSPSKTPSSPKTRPPAPTAKTYLSTEQEEEAYSFRPYDSPKKPRRKKSLSSMAGSESSWAPSHTTTRTSPPPSFRGPYSTKDPDKIVIQAVYLFMNQFSKTPASQLVSGVGSVTDGLILRITTEGLFIDDDVRGVPQREWDVKAWTLKLVEVWCPPHCLNASASVPAGAKNSPGFLHKMAASRSRNADRSSAAKAFTGEEADAHLTEMLRACKDCCRLGLCDRTFKNADIPSSGQTGEWKSKGLHVLRATLRDQESKRYLFVVDEAESWKVAVGLQRLRRGTQVRQLGVSSMTPSDARATLDMLGWAG